MYGGDRSWHSPHGTVARMRTNAIKLKRLTKPAVLKCIGRDLLARFFERFRFEIAGPGPGFHEDSPRFPLSPSEGGICLAS